MQFLNFLLEPMGSFINITDWCIARFNESHSQPSSSGISLTFLVHFYLLPLALIPRNSFFVLVGFGGFFVICVIAVKFVSWWPSIFSPSLSKIFSIQERNPGKVSEAFEIQRKSTAQISASEAITSSLVAVWIACQILVYPLINEI